jgi:hypothetical protein
MLALVILVAITVLDAVLFLPAVDWSKVHWTPIVYTYGGFFIVFGIWHYLRAQWEIHKEDSAKMTILIRRLPQREKALLIQDAVIRIQAAFQDLIRGGRPANPVGAYLSNPPLNFVWHHQAIKQRCFQARYAQLFEFVSAASISVTDPTPPGDACSLCGFPNEISCDDFEKMLDRYLKAVRVYAAIADEEVQRSMISPVVHT